MSVTKIASAARTCAGTTPPGLLKDFGRKRAAERYDLGQGRRQAGTLARLDRGARDPRPLRRAHLEPDPRRDPRPKTPDLTPTNTTDTCRRGSAASELRQLSVRSDRPLASRPARRGGAPAESIRKALTLLGGILQRALEARLISTNPQRLVRKAAAPSATEEVRPFAPGVRGGEYVRYLRDRWMRCSSALLAYAGLRPQEARALLWAHVGERTLIAHAPKTRRHCSKPRR